jgi:60 kDa SS-A/Ro ribonucleoprotein
MPAFLTVVLADIDKPLFRKVFRKVIDNGKMLRNVIQMARSGAVTGKKFNMSAGTFRHAIQEWFNAKGAVGIVQGVHRQRPVYAGHPAYVASTSEHAREERDVRLLPEQAVEFDALPEVVRQYEKWKKHQGRPSARRGLPNARLARPDDEGVDPDRGQRAVDDDPHEPEHVRPPRRLQGQGCRQGCRR